MHLATIDLHISPRHELPAVVGLLAAPLPLILDQHRLVIQHHDAAICLGDLVLVKRGQVEQGERPFPLKLHLLENRIAIDQGTGAVEARNTVRLGTETEDGPATAFPIQRGI